MTSFLAMSASCAKNMYFSSIAVTTSGCLRTFLMMNASAHEICLTHFNKVRFRALKVDYCVPWLHKANRLLLCRFMLGEATANQGRHLAGS
jgi:hypothetical protein